VIRDLAAPPVRRLTPDDLQAVFAVSNAWDLREVGETDIELSDFAWMMATEGSEWFGVDATDGGLEAFAAALKRPEHITVEGDVRVRLGGDLTLGPHLLDLIKAAAERIAPQAPLHLFVHVDDELRSGWLTAAGGRVVRQFWRMAIDFDAVAVAEPAAPTGVELFVVGADPVRQRAVFDVVDSAFRDHFGHDPERGSTFEDFLTRTHAETGFDDTLWWLATVDGEPAAALVARELEGGGYVSTLGTLAALRGRGLGRLLLRTAFAEFRRRGFRRALLNVDAENPTGAVALYESVGMSADNSWCVYELLPPGIS